MACINQWERPKGSHFSHNPLKVDKLKEKEGEEEAEGGSEPQGPKVKFLLHFSSSLYFYIVRVVFITHELLYIILHKLENHDFKSQFQLKNEMYVKLWVRTYVQQVLPITTGILPPTINYFYKIITKSDFFFFFFAFFLHF